MWWFVVQTCIEEKFEKQTVAWDITGLQRRISFWLSAAFFVGTLETFYGSCEMIYMNVHDLHISLTTAFLHSDFKTLTAL